jgi:hypothetical protein
VYLTEERDPDSKNPLVFSLVYVCVHIKHFDLPLPPLIRPQRLLFQSIPFFSLANDPWFSSGWHVIYERQP